LKGNTLTKPTNQRVAVVTGASSGIGLLSAVELARRGFTVVATMRNLARRTKLDEAAAYAGVSDKLDVRRLDVTEFDSHTEFVAKVTADLGRIDVLVNNAGFSMAGFAEDCSLDELREQFETNFFGAVAMTKAVLPVMRQQKSGHIIQVSSIAGRCAHPVLSSYSGSKFALEGWSESLRLEMKPLGINVVLIEPGSFETDIWEANAHVAKRAFDASSPNHQRSLRFRDYVRKSVVKRNPIEVAQVIAAVAADPNPRMRYLVGPDAKMFTWIMRIIPWNRYERAVAKKLGL
jgi:NAD(P)-dependent dehydrogenase (short-subunit alcohol dehydrogenase family)